MSLINDMLRNIEAKRPDDPVRQNLQREIRALPAAPGGKGLRLGSGILAAVVLLAVGAAVLHADGRLLPLLGLETSAVTSPPPATTAQPVVPQAALAAAAPTVAPLEETADKLRLASNLEVLPLPAAPVLPVPDPVVPAPAASAAKNDVPAATPEPARPSLLSGPVKIEKSPLPATPRDRADAEYRKAEGALASGRSAEGLDGLRAALKIDPSYVQVRQALLRQLLGMRKNDEAMAVLQEGLEAQPAQTGWAMSLARLQLEQGDPAAADRSLARSQGYAEANADYAGFQGHLKSRLGAQRQAVGHYQRAARLAPGDGRWWLGLGLALEADGKAAEAKDAFRRSLATQTLSAELSAVAEQHLR